MPHIRRYVARVLPQGRHIVCQRGYGARGMADVIQLVKEPAREVHESVVSRLAGLLKQAEEGKIVSFAYAAAVPGGAGFEFRAGYAGSTIGAAQNALVTGLVMVQREVVNGIYAGSTVTTRPEDEGA